MKAFPRALATALWLPVVVFALWQLVAWRSNNIFFPPPSTIVEALADVVTAEFLLETVAPTLQLLLTGFVVGAGTGVVVGTLLGSHEGVRAVFSPIVVFLRSMPTAAKVPVLLGILGIGVQSLYWAVGLSVFLNVAIVTMLGVARVPVEVTNTGRVLQLGWVRQTFGVRLPAATGDILTGLQAALQVAILVTILVETLASGAGIGQFLLNAQYTFRIVELWVGLVVLGTIGLIVNETFHFIERGIAPWYFHTRGAA